jgi:hypothetical protein
MKIFLIIFILFTFQVQSASPSKPASKTSKKLTLSDLSEKDMATLLSLKNLKKNNISGGFGLHLNGSLDFCLEETIGSSGNIRYISSHNFRKFKSKWSPNSTHHFVKLDSKAKYFNHTIKLHDSFGKLDKLSIEEINGIMTFYIELNEKLIKKPVHDIKDPLYFIFYYNHIIAFSRMDDDILLHTPHKEIRLKKIKGSYRVSSVLYYTEKKKAP